MKKIENKYYTPFIEEFYVGFEFEYYHIDKWQKEKLGILNNFAALWGKTLNKKDFRVKFLNIPDLEELGWVECEFNTWRFNEFEIEKIIFPDYDYRYRITNNVDDNYYEIKVIIDIKNKSELKKLMKQLEIT